MYFIGLNLNIINHTLLDPIQNILKKVAEKAQRKYNDGKSSDEQLYRDALIATTIFFAYSQVVQSELILVIEKLCLSIINAKEMLEEGKKEIMI